jgi:DNA-binding NtrC family response regulator
MKILLADDQPDVLEALRLLVKAEGFAALTAGSPGAILATLEGEDVDVVLMDLNYARDTTSGEEGLDLLARIRALDASLPVVVMTAWGSVDTAVEAMRRGARDYVQKPWDNTRLLATLRTQVELGRAIRQSQRLERENQALRRRDLPALSAGSPAMAPVLRLLERIGPSSANVLITGEHGTGKEVTARWLHALSKRSSGPFIAVNAGGLAEGVFESELFGHVRGAFTDAKEDRVGCFEAADGGTLFLDEIANMPSAQQAKLLRVLETRELRPVGSSRVRRVDVRILSATNVNVAALVAEGRFREDLLYRLNTVEIALPPLRQRREDLPALAAHFLEVHARSYGLGAIRFDPAAERALLEHAFPGNIRELNHAIERALLMAQGGVIKAEDLSLQRAPPGSIRIEELTLEEAERQMIQRALGRARGNVTDAARALGLSRSALYRRLAHFGLKGSE